MKMINDWKPETKSLIAALQKAGFTIDRGHNGEDGFLFDAKKFPEFLDNLLACDESTLYVTSPTGRKYGLYLVLGNSPGELVADYSLPKGGPDEVEAITMAHYDKWSGRKQPMMPSPYKQAGNSLAAQQAEELKTLDLSELRRHASVGQLCRCNNCYCCAAKAELDRRNSKSPSH